MSETSTPAIRRPSVRYPFGAVGRTSWVTVVTGSMDALASEDCAVAAVEGAPTALDTRSEDPHHANIVGMCSRHSGPACPPVGGTSVVTLSGSLTADAILRAV